MDRCQLRAGSIPYSAHVRPQDRPFAFICLSIFVCGVSKFNGTVGDPSASLT